MGRTFLIVLLLLCNSITPVLAISNSYNIRVTATVLPSPEWIRLLRSNTALQRIELPFLNFIIFRLKLTDGQILIKNQFVDMSINNSIVSSQRTDNTGVVEFYLPKYPGWNNPQFSYTGIDVR